MLLWGSWGQSPCRAPGAQHPQSWGPTVPQARLSDHFTNRCLHFTWQVWNGEWPARESMCQERYLLFCFAFTRFDFLEQKVSPHHEGKLCCWFQWMLTHLMELCARNHCAMTYGCFISAVKLGRETVERSSSFTCSFLVQFTQNSGSEIQALGPACLVCSGGCPKSPRDGSVFSCGREPWACGSSTGTGAQADDGKQKNLGRGKEAGSFVDISAKSVPGPMSANILLFVSTSHFEWVVPFSNLKHCHVEFMW